MGKVKQTVKPAAKEAKTLQKKISKRRTIKNNDLVPMLKKIGIDIFLNDISDSKPTFQEEIDEKPFKSLLARPKNGPFDEDQIQSGVSALFKLHEKTCGQEPTLFEDGENIFLQIVCIKVPKTPTRQIHLNLPHSLLKSDSEICLIVQDREDAKDYDNTIEYYEKVLKKHGITNVKCIMPYHQFNNEYATQYELKRKLASLYDFFLVDGAVHGYVVSRLGKIFYAKRKMPVAFNLKASNLKTHFENVLQKSVLHVHSNSDCYSIEVGNTKMKPEEVAENVISIAEVLDEKFPGGWDNVRSLGVKTNSSMRIPLYLTLRRNNSVRVPVIKATRPKGFKAVTGELTTFSNRVVTVLPSGEVIVKDKNKKRPREDDDEELEFEDELSESEDEESPEALLKKMKQQKKKAKKEAALKREEESEDSNLEEAEESYLNFYKQEQVKMAKERKVNKKNVPQNKKVVEASEDDLNLEDSDGSDFDEIEHPNFDESEESDQEELTNLREKKAGNNKRTKNKKVKQETNNKKGNQNAKTNGKAPFESKQSGGKKGKPPVKKENVEVKQETKENKGGKKENKMEVVPILVKNESAIKETSGKKNKKLAKKQKEVVAPSPIENGVVPKQKKVVLTKQNGNALPKHDKKIIAVKEEEVKPPMKKAKTEIQNKSPKHQKVDKKSKLPNPFAKKAK